MSIGRVCGGLYIGCCVCLGGWALLCSATYSDPIMNKVKQFVPKTLVEHVIKLADTEVGRAGVLSELLITWCGVVDGPPCDRLCVCVCVRMCVCVCVCVCR
jgi:hypothetical protein